MMDDDGCHDDDRSAVPCRNSRQRTGRPPPHELRARNDAVSNLSRRPGHPSVAPRYGLRARMSYSLSALVCFAPEISGAPVEHRLVMSIPGASTGAARALHKCVAVMVGSRIGRRVWRNAEPPKPNWTPRHSRNVSTRTHTNVPAAPQKTRLRSKRCSTYRKYAGIRLRVVS